MPGQHASQKSQEKVPHAYPVQNTQNNIGKYLKDYS